VGTLLHSPPTVRAALHSHRSCSIGLVRRALPLIRRAGPNHSKMMTINVNVNLSKLPVIAIEAGPRPRVSLCRSSTGQPQTCRRRKSRREAIPPEDIMGPTRGKWRRTRIRGQEPMGGKHCLWHVAGFHLDIP
jgi:hypothetical protein